MKKLLIIGAGGHGYVVKETAEIVGEYEKIDFVDDNCEIAVGKITDLEKLHQSYDSAFVSIGNNVFRNQLMNKLENMGYELPILVHPTAYVSKSSKIGAGTIIEPKAAVNANVFIGKGCIVSVGAVVDHNAVVGNYCHINAGAVVKSGIGIQDCTKIDAGQVAE